MLAACAPAFHPALPGAPTRTPTFVDVDGVHVRYKDVGSGPAVVLIHGFGASADNMGAGDAFRSRNITA